MLSTNVILNDLIEKLPEIASKMPQIKELKIFQSNNDEPLVNNLLNFIQKIITVVSSLNLNEINKVDKDKK